MSTTDAPSQTTVRFGNDNPHIQIVSSGGVITGSQPAPHLNQSVTSIVMEPGFDDPEIVASAVSTDNDRTLLLISRTLDDAHKKYAIGIQQLEQIVGVHAGGTKPAWVDSSDPEFAKALGTYFNCAVGEPTALLTNGGRDVLHAQHLSTAAQPAAFNYMAVTANTTTPAATDTTLTGEITTAGGGLLRAQATFAHTAGTNTSTLTKTFTANGSDALPVTLAQIGVFNATSGGTIGYHTALNATAALNVAGDNVTVTETVTAG
jgi:hypothetical protein